MDLTTQCDSSCNFSVLALAFAVLNPSTAWSHSSGDASFLFLTIISSFCSSSLSISGCLAVTVDTLRAESNINLIGDFNSELIWQRPRGLMLNPCLKFPKPDRPSNSAFHTRIPSGSFAWLDSAEGWPVTK
uniref:Uncharacterized protein MANES_01G018300 n=1 Tax=Rhizophora mucronata TaxID=61149 RepID=A0A2P2M536_RHIMU